MILIKSFTIRFLLLVHVVLFSTTIFPANIIFDMNGVLVTQAAIGTAWEIGLHRFVGGFNPLRIEDTFLNFLDLILPRRPETPLAVHKDRPLSQLMCDFQMGILTGHEVRQLVTEKLDDFRIAIDSKRKAQLIQAIVDCVFTPERFAKLIVPIKNGVKILKKCYRHKDANGNRAHKIFILTNWDAESFPLLFENKKIRKFLDLADGIVVSGVVGLMKPDPEMFAYAFKYFGIDPDQELTFFIDDELSNIKAARALNKRHLKCIHCQNFGFVAVDKTLHTMDIY